LIFFFSFGFGFVCLFFSHIRRIPFDFFFLILGFFSTIVASPMTRYTAVPTWQDVYHQANKAWLVNDRKDPGTYASSFAKSTRASREDTVTKSRSKMGTISIRGAGWGSDIDRRYVAACRFVCFFLLAVIVAFFYFLMSKLIVFILVFGFFSTFVVYFSLPL
jgi:hypothetical protein